MAGDGHCLYHSLLYGLSRLSLTPAIPVLLRCGDNPPRLSFHPEDINAMKARLMGALQAYHQDPDAIPEDTTRVLLEQADEEVDGSAPLRERLTRDSSAACDLRHFATEAELLLAAAAYDVKICVHQQEGGRVVTFLPDLSVIDGLPTPATGCGVLHVLFRQGHYDAIKSLQQDPAPTRLKKVKTWPQLDALPPLSSFLCRWHGYD